MNSTDQIRAFYIGAMNCPLTTSECPSAWKDYEGGVVPRAFTPATGSIVDILVVAKNPGHPLDGEREVYRGKRGAELYDAKLKFSERHEAQISSSNDPSLKYHRNLLRYLRFFLKITPDLQSYSDSRDTYRPEHWAEVHERVWDTNLFKCSTSDEQQKMSAAKFMPCYKTHFMDEVRLASPKVILALGREVEQFLKGRSNLGVPVVGVKHPSYFYGKEVEKMRLAEIKSRIDTFL